ncbi:hypothetical protein ACW5WN_20965 [Aeromonas lacus]|uniref:hypothetical protein n=1 Tax=Aeromonas lacus TaxID=558884 RepID=UPI00051B3E93|nr:hypothetical protein [Aeromonas lacus]
MTHSLTRIIPIAGAAVFSAHVYSTIVSAPSAPIQGHAPIADKVVVSNGAGTVITALPGQNVSASYDFFDADGDAESGSTFIWLRKDGADYTPLKDGSGNEVISQSLALSAAMAGERLRVCVTPRTSVESSLPARGAESCSGDLLVSYPAPSIALAMAADNEYVAGKTIGANYTFTGDGGNKSRYVWFRGVSADELQKALASDPSYAASMVSTDPSVNAGRLTYTLTEADVGQQVSLAAVADNGTVGDIVAVQSDMVISAAAPRLLATETIFERSGVCGRGEPRVYINCNVAVRVSLGTDVTSSDVTKFNYAFSFSWDSGKTLLPIDGASGTVTGTDKGAAQTPNLRVPMPVDMYPDLYVIITPVNSANDQVGPPVLRRLGLAVDPTAPNEAQNFRVEETTPGSGAYVGKWKNRLQHQHPQDFSYYLWSTKSSVTRDEVTNMGVQLQSSGVWYYNSSTGENSDVVTPHFTPGPAFGSGPVYLHILQEVGPYTFPADAVPKSVSSGFAAPALPGVVNPANQPSIAADSVLISVPDGLGGKMELTYDFHSNGGYPYDASRLEVQVAEAQNAPNSDWKTVITTTVTAAGTFIAGHISTHVGKYVRFQITPISSRDKFDDRTGSSPSVSGAPFIINAWDRKLGPSESGTAYQVNVPAGGPNLTFNEFVLSLRDMALGYTPGNEINASYKLNVAPFMKDASKYLWGYGGTTASKVLTAGSDVSVLGPVKPYRISNADVGKVIEISIQPREVEQTFTNNVYRKSLAVQTKVTPYIFGKTSSADLMNGGLGYIYLLGGAAGTVNEFPTWDQANNDCRIKGMRLPTVDELKNISADKASRPDGWPKEHLYWTSEEVEKPVYKTVQLDSGDEVPYGGGFMPESPARTPAVCVKPQS